MVIVLVCGLVAPARAEAETAVLDLSPPGADARDARVRVDDSGAATVVWWRSSIIRARRIAPDGTVGAVVDLGIGQAEQVAVDRATGTATVVWEHPNGFDSATVQARRIAPDGTPGPIMDLSEANEVASFPLVTVDAAGTATVVWLRSDNGKLMIRARRIAADTTLGPALDLSAPGELAIDPTLAVHSAGAATVVWRSSIPGGFILRTRRIAPEGTLGPTTNLFTSGVGDFTRAVVAVDPAGTATVVRERETGASVTLQERRITADGALGAIRDLSPPLRRTFLAPRVAVDGAGSTIVVWQRVNRKHAFIQLRRIARNGTLGRTRTWSAGLGAPQVAVAARGGDAVAVWEHRRRAINSTDSTIKTRRIGRDGTLGPIRNLSATGITVYDPLVAVGDTDAATAVWTHFDGTSTIVQGRQFRYQRSVRASA